MATCCGLAVMNRYGPAGWNCTDFPAAEGETPVGGVFIKQRCEKVTPSAGSLSRRISCVQARPDRHRSQERANTGRASTKAGPASRCSIRRWK